MNDLFNGMTVGDLRKLSDAIWPMLAYEFRNVPDDEAVDNGERDSKGNLRWLSARGER